MRGGGGEAFVRIGSASVLLRVLYDLWCNECTYLVQSARMFQTHANLSRLKGQLAVDMCAETYARCTIKDEVVGAPGALLVEAGEV